MRLAILAVGSVLVLVSIGLTLVRTGHPRVVAPLMAGLVGILVIVTALVVSRSPAPARPRAHRPAPVVAATPAPAPVQAPPPQDATGPGFVCDLRLPMPAKGHLPGPKPADTQALPEKFPAMPDPYPRMLAAPLVRSHTTLADPSGVPDAVGGALVDYDTGRYFTAPHGVQSSLIVTIGTVKTRGCGRYLVTSALRDDIVHPSKVVLVRPDPQAPHLTGYSGWVGCGQTGSRGYDICAWATDSDGGPLFGEVIFHSNLPGLSKIDLPFAVEIADTTFWLLTLHL